MLIAQLKKFFRGSGHFPQFADGTVEGAVSLHSEGLSRIMCVIEAAPHYDVLIRGRLSPSDIVDFSADVPIEVKRDRAIVRAENALSSVARKILAPRFQSIACDGRSQNNLREFDFFDGLCTSIGLSLKGQNYSIDGSRKRATRSKRDEQQLLNAICSDIRRFYAGRTQIGAGLVVQQINFSKWYYNHIRSFTQKHAILPKAIVLANDHWPSYVAMSMVMKGFGVPRIYLQHAEVSPIFPPLDFEYSILRSQQSLDIYREIGPVSGQCYVISRHASSENFEQLMKPRTGKQLVVIYSTARIETDSLYQMVKVLTANDCVQKVLIKRHPRCDHLSVGPFLDTGAEVVDALPETEHVAIVGNSSTVIELLARGIPVWQNFELDPGVADYYGFVRAGLCTEVTMQMLNGHFVQPFNVDNRWRAEFSKWVPDGRKSEAEKLRFVSAMHDLVSNR